MATDVDAREARRRAKEAMDQAAQAVLQGRKDAVLLAEQALALQRGADALEAE